MRLSVNVLTRKCFCERLMNVSNFTVIINQIGSIQLRKNIILTERYFHSSNNKSSSQLANQPFSENGKCINNSIEPQPQNVLP